MLFGALKPFLPEILRNLFFRVARRRRLYKSGSVVSVKDTFGGNHVLKITRNDCLFPIYIRGKTSDEYVYDDIFCRGEYAISVETPPVRIIDAGANIGLASVYFANQYPDATIIAIEPELANYTLLVQNTKNYPNVIPLQVALWDTITELNLFDSGLGSWAFMVGEDSAQNQLSVPVVHEGHLTKTITIEKILEDYNMNEIDILKMDIEGAEKEVFESSAAWIKKVKSLIIELHERYKAGCNRAFYNNTNGFDHEWQRGEDIFLTRGKFILPPENS